MPTYLFPAEAGQAPEGTLGAGSIRARLRALGLPAEGLDILCEGGRVRIEGRVPDPGMQERILLAIGNLAGVERVEDRMVPAARPGLLDALGGFARLPAGAAGTGAAREQVHRAAPEPGDRAFGPAGSLFHTVQPGETLEGIAQRRYGMTREAWRIREANAGLLPEGAPPHPGMVLRLPEGRRRGPAPSTG